eukprot:CAMPEP_0116992040 /NCGR_PEP_ID=MMETSP0467-20121206/66531_1 /TAXON_ID=283647 /ORGANISM="Mesodinium pulex, Strain SPMC105" /LENGTH=67 /DNA_ID=CAMNT_0004689307 /DNA_START=305 /DNA_END=508 /DNA_ORIENTATION=-
MMFSLDAIVDISTYKLLALEIIELVNGTLSALTLTAHEDAFSREHLNSLLNFLMEIKYSPIFYVHSE